MNRPPSPAHTLGALALLVVALLSLARRSHSEDAPAIPTSQTQTQTHYVVGLSPFLDPTTRNEAFRHLVRFLAEDLPAHSRLTLLDAYHLQSITHLTIPGHRAFQSPRTRLNQFADAIQTTRRFLAASNTPPTSPGLDFNAAVRLPQFLDFVSANLLSPNQPAVVVILGSPLYQDDREPSFSMAHGYFPTDGHLLARAERSVFSLEHRSGHLRGVTLHAVHPGDPWTNDLHREKITRFWRLFIEHQGGQLASLCGDLPTTFRRIDTGPTQPPTRNTTASVLATSAGPTPAPDPDPAREPGAAAPAIDPTDTRVEMIRVTRDIGSSDWIAGDRIDRPAAGPPTLTRGPLRIGIRWQGRVDLDLYARARPGAPRLYFEQPSAPGALYYKDLRASTDRDFEFVEFTTATDLREVEAEVNLHAGHAPPGGVDGEVRVEFADRIYASRFHLDATHGNRGREGAGQEPFWCRLDIPAITRLP